MASKKDDALMIVARYLRKLSRGAVLAPKDCKLMSDLCFLALPMKYRMTKAEIAQERTLECSEYVSTKEQP